jgi:FlaA1/EpsC-like NDP-sugar epimerase/CheY-like chemotaxis protein
MILREMVYHYSHNYEVVGLIDDDPKKHRKQIHGVPVLGSGPDIPEIVRERSVEEIIIAIPSATPEQKRGIVDYCIKSGAKYRTVPNMSDLVDGTVKVKELREVRLEDLLKRDEILLDRQRMAGYITGKAILITGAGGSIGSELCRQVARFAPLKLILFEKSENSLFYIDMELEQLFKDLKKVPVVGDICDRKRVKEVLLEHKPQIIFHAAAHKHVPLMELNPLEAVKNNIFGTKILAEEAIKYEVDRFIMLSTDKVVSPTSVMGVTKRITEIYLQSLCCVDRTKFMAVRFGNVLGSEGSVIPTFRRQIEKGGPVTVTHPDIKRYFMTIPEAAVLVLEAGFMGEGGEIFILEMGRQIKILDLAHEMIRLSGLIPEKDIKIIFSGLRPGEKLHEALITEDESLRKTAHEKITVVEEGKRYQGDIFADLDELRRIVETSDIVLLVKKLKEIVPRYKPSAFITEEQAFHEKEKTKCYEGDILIADDEKIIQELLSKFLEGKGYNTFLASNGREALNAIIGNDIKVAIVDIKMPGFIDGFQVLKRMKKINNNIEVIMITGFGSERIRKLSSDLGAYAYVEKPFDLADIKMRIECALQSNKKEGLS